MPLRKFRPWCEVEAYFVICPLACTAVYLTILFESELGLERETKTKETELGLGLEPDPVELLHGQDIPGGWRPLHGCSVLGWDLELSMVRAFWMGRGAPMDKAL